MEPIGRKRWAIAEGYIPSQSSFTERALVSHETACILNAGDHDAHVIITIFFANREPAGPYRVTVGKKAANGIVEVVTRKPSQVTETRGTEPANVDVPIDAVVTHLKSLVQEDELLGGTSA